MPPHKYRQERNTTLACRSLLVTNLQDARYPVYSIKSLFNNSPNKVSLNFFIFIMILLSGCGSGGGNVESKTGALIPTSIAITPATSTVANGQTTNFSVTATYTDGSTANISKGIVWSSSDATIASIDSATGVAKGSKAGSATTITASLNGIPPATASLQVTAAVITAITISPATQSTPKGVAVTYSALGTYSDQSAGNVSGSVIWSSDTPNVVTLSNTGKASSLAIGTTKISASTNGIISNSATLTVTPPVLTAIAINPTNATVAYGLSTNFTATGTYTDGSTADITSLVTWASANASIATINNAGVAKGGTTGNSTTITASFNGVPQASASLSVTSAVIIGLTITPTTQSTPKGVPVTYTATAAYSDTSSGNVSGSVTWSSSNTAVAALNSSGIASSLAQGVTTVTASANGVTSNGATLTVSSPAFSSISITPTSANVVVGKTQQLTASGSMTDGTTATPANLATLTWPTSNAGIGSINGSGLFTATSAGSCNINASGDNIISNTATLTTGLPPSSPNIYVSYDEYGTQFYFLNWPSVIGATSYNLYYASTAGVTTSSTKSTGVVGSGMVIGNTSSPPILYFRVSAVNIYGETLSNEVQ